MKTRREFLQTTVAGAAGSLLPLQAGAQGRAPQTGIETSARPNIVFILVDDLGFSDMGCYGSEIETPHVDALAKDGLRFTQFYNSPRCCPSRAALLTGLYSHQAGMGMMTADYGRYPYPAYAGDLSDHCVTIAEALKAGGYATYMAGKWHLTPLTVDKHNWPLQRGFDHYYGIIAGAANYYDPATLTRDNTPIKAPRNPDFYFTDAIAENAAAFIENAAHERKPFFLYAAFNAPHWPLQAPEETIAKYKDRYLQGWDRTRAQRHAKQIDAGIVTSRWGLTHRDQRVPPWELASYRDWEARRMAVYAAQVDRMDQDVGKIVAKLKGLGLFDNTLIFFMADNGGNFEEMHDFKPNQKRPVYMPYKTKDGKPVVPGNNPEIMPGLATTFQSYGIPWGNVSNTPFRLYKHYAHEGGISTPFIVHWPQGMTQKNALTHVVGHEIDVMATCLDVAGVAYPTVSKAGTPPPPLEGKSLLSVLRGRGLDERSLFWEHEGNCAVREGRWKLVSRFPDYWELYDMEQDRTEMHDVANRYPDRVRKMAADYAVWAKRVGAQPWPMPQTPQRMREGAMPSPPYLRKDRW